MDFHPFAERFPTIDGPDWDAFKTSVRKTGGNEEPVTYRMAAGKRQGLDGRNRLRACLELGLAPRLQQVDVPDADVKDYILRRNVHRRHLTVEARRAIVAELRADGESVRQIAAAIGVSVGTVHSDIKESGVQNRTPDSPNTGKTTETPPKPATVTGKDGKEYPATQAPSLFCERCRRVGPVKDCKDCAGMRAAKPQAKRSGPKNGAEVPTLAPFKEYLGRAQAELNRLARFHGSVDTRGRPTGPGYHGLWRKLDETLTDAGRWLKDLQRRGAS